MTIWLSHIGYAVLWAISDKEDEPAMQVIFSSVKKRCPNGENKCVDDR